jgi:hypothetical protein
MNLTYLLLLLGLVMFLNQAVYAQNGSAAILQADVTNNLLKRFARDSNQYDLCLGSMTVQISYKSYLETRDEESEFIIMNRKYYRKDTEIIKASPLVFNSFFNYYSFPKDSTKLLETREFYLRKSKNQKTVANILVGVGSVAAIVGIVGVAKYGSETLVDSFVPGLWDPDAARKAASKADTYSVILLAGIAADLVSIPFFISAHHNKKKAATLSFDNQTIYSPLDKPYCSNLCPSLTLRIKL